MATGFLELVTRRLFKLLFNGFLWHQSPDNLPDICADLVPGQGLGVYLSANFLPVVFR
jgi:hypothetical protein